MFISLAFKIKRPLAQLYVGQVILLLRKIFEVASYDMLEF
jgi:hypothetical protein